MNELLNKLAFLVAMQTKPVEEPARHPSDILALEQQELKITGLVIELIRTRIVVNSLCDQLTSLGKRCKPPESKSKSTPKMPTKRKPKPRYQDV